MISLNQKVFPTRQIFEKFVCAGSRYVNFSQGGLGVFVSFEDYGCYGASDAFYPHDFLLQDVSEFFYAGSGNEGDYVKFTLDVIDFIDVFELCEGVYNLCLQSRVDKDVDRGFESSVVIVNIHFASSKQLSCQATFELF